MQNIPLERDVDISVFDLDKWNKDILTVPIEPEKAYKVWPELEQFFINHVSEGGWFMKMHHSPKDYEIRPIHTSDDVIRTLFYSERLRENLFLNSARKLYFQPFRTIDPKNEARVFFHHGKPVTVRWMVPQDRLIDISTFNGIKLPWHKCCMDVEMYGERYRIIEFNPLDYETDLYD